MSEERILYFKDGDGYNMRYAEDSELVTEDSTFTPPPSEYIKGEHYTIEKGKWVSVLDAPLPELDLEACRSSARIKFNSWEKPYLNSPFVFENNVYINDEKFREMMLTATVAYREYDGRLPKGWFTATGDLITPVTKEWMDALGETAYSNYEDKTMTAGTISKTIYDSQDCEELLNIAYPEIPTVESLVKTLKKEK